MRFRFCPVLTVDRASSSLSGAALGSRKARTLLALLVAARGSPVATDRLAWALWADHPPADPPANLATLASRLRRTLGDDVIRAADHGYALGPASGWTLDLDEAAGLCVRAGARQEAGEPGLAAAAARSALQLVGAGPVLADVGDAEWVDAARQEAAELRRRGRHLLVEALLATEPPAAAEVARAAVDADPFDERATRDLMRALVADGRTTAALRAHEHLARRLRDELGTSPDRRTTTLHLEVLRDQELGLERPRADAPPGDDEPAAGIVGRHAELRVLAAAWSGAGTGRVPNLLLVRGEAGIGKTRLLEAAGDVARATGGLVLDGRCHPSERSLFLQPFVDALRPALTTTGPTTLHALVEGHREAWASMLPELGEVLRRTGPPASDPDLRRRRCFDAVAATLDRLGRERPVLLRVDDLQDGGAATVDLLGHLGSRLAAAPVVLLGAVRADDVEVVPRLGGRAVVLDLGGLTRADVGALAAAAGVEAAADEVMERTAGHSLSVVESLRAIASGDEGLPESLAAAVLGRVERLPQASRTTLEAAAVLRRRLAPRMLADLVGTTEVEAARRCEELVRHGLLVRSDASYEFANDLLQEVLHGALPPAVARALHRAAADLVADRPEAMAEHAAAAGEDARAARGWLLAGEQPAACRAGVLAGGGGVLGHRLGPVGDQVGGRPVEGPGHGRRQGAVEDLLEQVVGELVGGVAADEQAVADQLLAAAGGLDLGGADEVGQHPRGEPSTEHGGGLERRPRRLRQPFDPAEDRGRERLGQALVARGDRAQALDDAERVTGGALHHLVRRRLDPGGRCQRTDVGARQAAEVQHDRAPAEPWHDLDVVGAHRPEQDHGCCREPGPEVAQQVDGRGTAVLQVVDPEQDGALPAETVQRRRDRVEAPTAPQVGVGGGWPGAAQHLAELGEHRGPRLPVALDEGVERRRAGRGQGGSQGVDERLEEEGALGGVAAPVEHEPAGGSRHVARGLQQPGLADAGLPAHQQQVGDPARPRTGPGGRQHAELRVPSDDPGGRFVVPGGRVGPGALEAELLVAQDLQVERRRPAVGGGAELVAQPPCQVLVRPECRGRATVGHEGPHQVAGRALVEGVCIDGRARDLGRRRGLGREQRLHQEVAAAAAELGSLLPCGVDPLGVADVGQDRTGPDQLQGRPGRRGGQPGLARLLPGTGPDAEPRRLVEVEGPAGRGTQGVAVVGRADHVIAQGAPEAAGQGGEVGRRVGRRVVGPQGPREAVGGHRAAPCRDQQREERAGLPAPEGGAGQRRGRPVHGQDRAEPEPHRRTRDPLASHLTSMTPAGAEGPAQFVSCTVSGDIGGLISDFVPVALPRGNP